MTEHHSKKHAERRLYRSDTNKIFGGVIGGIGEYADIDPTILRLVWLIVTVFTGVLPGVIIYVFALFIVPRRRA